MYTVDVIRDDLECRQHCVRSHKNK